MPKQSDWQPMRSAPQTRPILMRGAAATDRPFVGQWLISENCWVACGARVIVAVHAAYWAEIPEFPKELMETDDAA